MILVLIAVVCVSVRLPLFISNDNAALMAAALTVSKGNYTTETTKQPAQQPKKAETQPVSETVPTQPSASDFSSSYYNTFAKHKNSEKYPIYAKQYTDGGDKYNNFYVKNKRTIKLFFAIFNSNPMMNRWIAINNFLISLRRNA